MFVRAVALTAVLLPCAAIAQTSADKVTGPSIEMASYTAGDLPNGRSALTAKVQILLDRSGTSPGVIDGFKGGMSESAIRAFERRAGLPIDGIMDPQVWSLLQSYVGTALTQDYTITEADAADLVEAIPADYAEKAQMAELGYTSIAEKLGERFHMDEKFIGVLNPGVSLVPGTTITVVTPAPPIKGQVTRIIVDKATRRVAGYNASGQMVVDYPATIGSDSTPSPSGDHTVVSVALNPNYTYNPKLNFKQGENDKVLTIPPGPNGPVGTVWIDLSKPTYGIHGTPTPSQLFSNQSRGCVRLTNWDAQELSKLVRPGETRVEFLQPGVTIADVTDTPKQQTTISAARPAKSKKALEASQPTTEPTLPTEPTSDVYALPTVPAQIPLPAEGAFEPNPAQSTPAPAAGAGANPADDQLLDALNNALENPPTPETGAATQ